MTGPIAKEISDEFDVDPRRSASLLDMFTSVGQGLIPYGAQLLTAAALTGLTPFDFMPYLIYPMLMAVCGIVAICIRRERKSAEYSGIYLVENCVAERKRGKIMNLLYKSTRNSEKQ